MTYERSIKRALYKFFTDFGFKRLFGSEPTKECLIDFLNYLLEGLEESIKGLDAFCEKNFMPQLTGYVQKMWAKIGRKRNYVITGGRTEI